MYLFGEICIKMHTEFRTDFKGILKSFHVQPNLTELQK